MSGRTQTEGSIRRHLLLTSAAVLILVGGIGVMGATTELSGAVVAVGLLVVESNVKKVQHPTGGIVEELVVNEGSHVEAGSLLIRLDKTTAQANLAAITKALWELSARGARLNAEREGNESIAFTPDLLQAGGDPEIGRIISGERRLFELRREALNGQKAQLRERISQLKNQVAGLAEQIAAKNTESELIHKELAGVRQLWERSLISITRLTALEREAARLQGERGSLLAATAQNKEKISETELQVIQLDQNLRSEVAKELSEIRAKSSDLSERKVMALDQLERIEIRAPQKGIVHQLSVFAKGAVIAAGEQIMLIVPEADALVAEVRVPPQNIDQVRLNQPATLRFPTFNQRATPELNGFVKRVAADVMENQRTGNSYYLIRIAIAPEEIARLQGLTLVPGMPVDAFLRTEERTMLSYLLKPLGDQVRRAFREK
jgi:HlyD family secretion protein